MFRILLVFVMVLPLFSQNLANIIKLAYQNDLIKIKEQEILKSSLKKEQLDSQYLPLLTLGGGYERRDKDNFLISPKEARAVYARLEYLLFDGFKKEARREILDSENQKDFLKSDEFKNELAFLLTTLYFNAVLTDNLINAKISQKEYLNNELKRLNALKNAGLASNDELSLILAKSHLAQSELLSLKQDRLKILNEISLYANENLDSLNVSSLKMPDFDNLAQNYELKGLEIDIKKSQSAIDEAKSSHYPRIFLSNKFSVYKNRFDDINEPFRSYAGQFFNQKRSEQNEFMLGFEWLIFDFFATSKGVQIAQISQNQAILNLNHKKRENEIELKNLQNEIEISRQKIAANELFVKAADTALSSISKKYHAGLVGYSEFLLALLNDFDAKSALAFSQSDFEIKKARYYLKSGIEILKRIDE